MGERKTELEGILGRVRAVRGRFAPGTPQRTLADRRVEALEAALRGGVVEGERERRTLGSMLSKMEKSRVKVRAGSWQERMLQRGAEALRGALGETKTKGEAE